MAKNWSHVNKGDLLGFAQGHGWTGREEHQTNLKTGNRWGTEKCVGMQ
jgi:hypothetical protein